MSAKKIKRRSKVKPFIKIINYNHLMPTRYTLELEGLKGVITSDTFKEPSQKLEARKTIRKTLEDKYNTGKNKWFFQPLSELKRRMHRRTISANRSQDSERFSIDASPIGLALQSRLLFLTYLTSPSRSHLKCLMVKSSAVILKSHSAQLNTSNSYIAMFMLSYDILYEPSPILIATLHKLRGCQITGSGRGDGASRLTRATPAIGHSVTLYLHRQAHIPCC